MNQLITAVEIIKSNYATKEDLAGIKEDQAVIKSNYATKEDLSSVKEDLAVIKNNYTTKEELATVKADLDIIKSNYATKEELATLSGKVDVLASNQQALQANLLAFQAHAVENFVTKAELSDAVYQLTWRMAGFAVASVSATAAFVRYL
ncbi:hypothetical protein GTP44_09645 [Duganella sp. FT50W]|uniref:DUF1640 domain-containing protein n=1 Tax=Duganella lactea TaxID=2692173 RepID=A0A6L8MI83_9BURK|nr:hypothetical protein [Duganella lactea]MYM82214.1 hypothetical protein [Duganella lactea]